MLRKHTRWIRDVRVFAIAAAALTLGACADNTTPRIATTVAMVSGNNQTVVAGLGLSAPLIVSVLDQDGLALSGVAVTWSITSGEGTLTVTQSTTDANGQATNSSFAASIDAGDAVVTATVAGLTPITFTLSVEPTETGGS